MYNFKFIITFLTLILLSQLSYSQVVYTPSDHYVYEFLERLALKDIIDYHNEVKPISRKKIADFLVEASLKKEKLNPIELKELDWLFEEYAYEINSLSNLEGNDEENVKERWYLYSYSDSLFSLKVSPLIGYGISGTGDANGHTRWWGLDLSASHSDWFGASFSAKDLGQFGDNVDREKHFTPATGLAYKPAPDGIESSDIRGSISFNWDWGHISLAKDYTQWGHGNFGQLILSEKAPPYTFIRLDLYPLEWLRFYYIHGWLNSLVYDSSEFSYNHIESREPFLRKDYINKYIAANFLSLSIFPWFDLSFGNSIVYSGKLRPEFFIPFLFFKHFDNRGADASVEDGNKQVYIDAAINYPKSYFLYSTLFIDVTEIRPVLENNFNSTWIGFTVGAKKVDLFLPWLDISAEYTRTNPWLYEHKDETTTYKHLNYTLGHWLGQNADQFRIQFDYRPLRGLKLKTYTEYIRKGRLNDIYFAYGGQDESPEKFLASPPVRREIRFGFEASYEILHDLFAEGYYSYADITDEDLERTPSFLLGRKHSFALTLHYGL